MIKVQTKVEQMIKSPRFFWEDACESAMKRRQHGGPNFPPDGYACFKRK